jgi:hypothetical protein
VYVAQDWKLRTGSILILLLKSAILPHSVWPKTCIKRPIQKERVNQNEDIKRD